VWIIYDVIFDHQKDPSPQFNMENSSQPFASIILIPIAGTLLNWEGMFNVIDGGIGVFMYDRTAHWFPYTSHTYII